MHRKVFRGTLGHSTDFPAKRVNISWDEGFLAGVGVEVTVGAAVGAKGDMEVKGVVHEVQREEN